MEEQIQELYKPLFFYIKKRIASKEDAEDITQEVFYKLSKSTDTELESLKSWVYTIAKNTITDYYRNKKRSGYTEDINELLLQEADDEYKAVQDLGACIGAYVDKLPDAYREIVRLADLDKVPQKDIAERMGVNYVTVRSKVQRGRKKLKEIFSACCTVMQGSSGSILDYSQKNGCGEESPSCATRDSC